MIPLYAEIEAYAESPTAKNHLYIPRVTPGNPLKGINLPMHRDLPVSNTSEQREPSARLQRPGIKDPKLLMGILLILVSIVGVIAVIQLNNHTTQYYAAKSDIHVGDKITSDMLTPVDANLGSSSERYITSEEINKGDLMATRYIASGEIIGKDSTGTNVRENRRLVTVTIDRGSASALKAGEQVDVWAVQRDTVVATAPQPSPQPSASASSDSRDNPSASASPSSESQGSNGSSPIVSGAEISSISKEESVLGANGKATVQLWVNPNADSSIVEANGSEAKITLVPVALGRGN